MPTPVFPLHLLLSVSLFTLLASCATEPLSQSTSSGLSSEQIGRLSLPPANNRRELVSNARKKGLLPLAKLDPSLIIKLPYGTKGNVTGKVLYPSFFTALLRKRTAGKVLRANALLKEKGYRLVIWDAYRPTETQEALWNSHPVPNFVGNPKVGWSTHCCGVAVDVTLADLRGKLIKMPSDFDDFSHRALSHYVGGDPDVKRNLATLKEAMIAAGFTPYHKEWWHYTDESYFPLQWWHAVHGAQLGLSLPKK